MGKSGNDGASDSSETPPPTAEGHSFEWGATASLVSELKRPGERLGLSILYAGGEWLALAASTPAPEGRPTIDAFLERHGHRNIGGFEQLAPALAAAEAFGRAWMAGVSIDQCPCEEIADA